MDKPLTMEAVLEGGLDALLNPAAARREAGARLPQLAVTQIVSGVGSVRRAQSADRLIAETWRAVQDERRGRWDRGWAELVAGLALAVELLKGELPAQLRDELRGSPAEAMWREARRPHQRFVLLVDASVHIERVHAQPQRREPGVPVEESVRWAVDGRMLRGRSHTLMLALLADGALRGERSPVAATGELHKDGEQVCPVDSLAEKMRVWRQKYPEGLFISASPGRHDAQLWKGLLKDPQRHRAPLTQPWIVGASLCEITRKLDAIQPPRTGWDGAVLSTEALIQPRFSVSGVHPERISNDPLFDTCWSAWREAQRKGQRRGVLIHGAPGAGKSILSLSLEERFARGAFSALGYGVRRAARDLAADLEGVPGDPEEDPRRSWARVLAIRAPERAAFFEQLAKTQRLVPIVDGLDELQPAQAQRVSEWLSRGQGWWLATSRPLRGIQISERNAWCLELEPLHHEAASTLLKALGRADLVEKLWPSSGNGAGSSMLEEVTQTPLLLNLLTHVVRRGEDLHQIKPHHLYERLFEALLDHANRTQRLTVEAAGLVRHLLTTLVGELALAWLQSSEGHLGPIDIDAAFHHPDLRGMTPAERRSAMEALRFGHLLVPAGEGWGFGHRTLAEWAAAVALHRRVEHALSTQKGTTGQSERAQRAAVEREIISRIFTEAHGLQEDRWVKLLTFYAAYAKDPLALLDWMLGPASVLAGAQPSEHGWPEDRSLAQQALHPTTVPEVLDTWADAYQILRATRWHRTFDACLAWALGVRRWILADLQEGSSWRSSASQVLQAFAVAVGPHLPETWDGLVVLAARTDTQRAHLKASPMSLLPALPPCRAGVLEPFLQATDAPRQQLEVLAWYERQEMQPEQRILDQLAKRLSRKVGHTESWWSSHGENWASTVRDEAVLPELEAIVWRLSLAQRCEPPWPIVKRRFAQWPAHLEAPIKQWFVAVDVSDVTAYRTQEAIRRRREVLASLLSRAVQAQVQMSAGEGEEQAGEPHEKVDLRELRARAQTLCRALAEDARLDHIVGELWQTLPPGDAVQHEILHALSGAQRFPPQIPAEALLKDCPSPFRRSDEQPWSAEHREQLRQLSTQGVGQVRLNAICALAQIEGRAVLDAIASHLPSDDDVFRTLAEEYVKTWGSQDQVKAQYRSLRLKMLVF